MEAPRCRPRRATANRTEPDEICRLREGPDPALTISLCNAVVRALATLQIDIEDDYKRYLDEYPLPRQPRGMPT
jgi:hypothetical protein